MLEQYDQAIKQLQGQIKSLESQEGGEQQLEAANQMLDVYKTAREQLTEQFGDQQGADELTEEQITKLVRSAMQHKTQVASISSDGQAVFIASKMPVGHGYEVWRMTPEFKEAKVIVSELSGCCGQMDVQANKDGVFVAENSRKRVRRFDAEGKSVCDWGKSSEDVDGFGSCCNPMNLAFGADGAIYTAEDTTGRIKRYSSDGTLLSVVGAAEVVPGCKKVSIGVNATGDRVYMLDITKNNVAVLSRVQPDPTGPISAARTSKGGGSRLLRFFGLGE
jgi:sugar lactone lactonase YvrE